MNASAAKPKCLASLSIRQWRSTAARFPCGVMKVFLLVSPVERIAAPI